MSFMTGTLKPFIRSEDARSQADFYVQCFGGEIVSVLTHEQAMGAQHNLKDKVMHMCLSVAGSNYIFMADSFEPAPPGPGIALNMAFQTESAAREAFAGLAVGGRVIAPLDMQPFGMYYGELTDKYGVTWMITAERGASSKA